jgi:voltage-gated potassium channel
MKLIFKNIFNSIKKFFDNELAKIITILVVMWLFGAIGILVLESKNQPDFNSLKNTLWWTIVTMTTVGYGDMSPQGDYSRLFATFLMLTGIGISGLFTSTMSSIFVTKKIREGRGLETVKTKNHIVICGYNPNLEMILDFIIKSYNNEFPIVLVNDLSEDKINSILSKYSKIEIKFVKGDHSRENILEKANVLNSKSVMVLTDDADINGDQKTILSTLTLKNINSNLRVIAQVSNRENITHLRRANVDEIIINDKFETFMTASHILDPGVPQALHQLIDENSIHKFQSKSISKDFIGKTFDELSKSLRDQYGWIAIGLFLEEEKMGLSDFLSADTSSLDAFIEKKMKEAGHSFKQESKLSVVMNPESDYLIKKGERVIIIP